MIVAMALYVAWFTVDNKKSMRREDERLRALKVQGVVPADATTGNEKKGAA